MILTTKSFIHQGSYKVHVLITNLNEHAACFRQQVAGHHQPVTQISQIRMYAQLPGIPEGFYLLRLAGGVPGAAIFHIPLAGAHLPVRAELDAIGRVKVNHLHSAL
ncbi:hypothetical protein ES703_120435 [subsurface metagenome]